MGSCTFFQVYWTLIQKPIDHHTCIWIKLFFGLVFGSVYKLSIYALGLCIGQVFFLDTIRYNTFSCDIRYIGWTIFWNIFGENDKKNVREQSHLQSIDFIICMGHLADLVTNLLCHWWWTVIFVFQPDVATR